MNRKEELEKRLTELGNCLVTELNPEGYWEGRLSPSALGVAVATAALHFDNPVANKQEIQRGTEWLRLNINSDGSFGDTPESQGNVSASLLVYAALNLYSEKDKTLRTTQDQIEKYLHSVNIDVRSSQVADFILKHYRKDYTFSVPILVMCALCGVPEKDAFKQIPRLPFELSLLPHSFYRALNLSVVSYAIPALVAVGILIFKKKKGNLLWRVVRRFSIPKALKILHRMLPESGGYLEAIPLTAFVALSLINSGFAETETVKKGILFLKNNQREDGSWPIDVDLSTWVTSLAVKSFRSNLNDYLPKESRNKITDHFKLIQNRKVHPFNRSGPGGWGWTRHAGSVPDADDTPGAILALLRLQPAEQVKTEVVNGCKWLVQIQNSDGGFPTFSKGWGKLPFDRSCADLTGHSLLAISAVLENYHDLPARQKKDLQLALKKALRYLERHQRNDGSWIPLWFGNQQTPDHTNPVYGTAKVTACLKDAAHHNRMPESYTTRVNRLIKTGEQYLVTAQNRDGSWGGAKNIPGTMEETALAVTALVSDEYHETCLSGLSWLDHFYRENGLKAAPVGLYFASLWYDEKLYPLTAWIEALVRTLEDRR